MEIEVLEKGILEKLPQTNFVVDQVGLAMQIAREALAESDYTKTLKVTARIADYASKVSEVGFYKYPLIVASLLADVPNIDEKIVPFKSASGAVEAAVAKTRVSEEMIQKKGCFKALCLHLVPLSKENQDYFACMLCHILEDLEDLTAGMKEAGVKSPITPSDYVTILGYSYVMNCVYSSATITGYTSTIINNIQIILNDLSY